MLDHLLSDVREGSSNGHGRTSMNSKLLKQGSHIYTCIINLTFQYIPAMFQFSGVIKQSNLDSKYQIASFIL